MNWIFLVNVQTAHVAVPDVAIRFPFCIEPKRPTIVRHRLHWDSSFIDNIAVSYNSQLGLVREWEGNVLLINLLKLEQKTRLNYRHHLQMQFGISIEFLLNFVIWLTNIV